MNMLPKVSNKTITIQIITFIILSLSLAFYVWQQNIQQQLTKSLMDLRRHQSQLQTIEEQSKQFNALYKQYDPNINTKWKHMVFQWDNIAFEELQHRIDTLYADCNILFPESLEIKKTQSNTGAQQAVTNTDSQTGYSIKLKIVGQWLCGISNK